MADAGDGAMSAPLHHVNLLVQHVLKHRDPASIPVAAREAAKMFMFDSIGVALSGAAVPESEVVRRALAGWGSGGNAAHVWGSRETLPAPSAAMVNAFHIHNQEFDCVHEGAVVHPMAVILAALTAFAQSRGHISGTKFLAALAIAVDVATVIGMSATQPIRFFRPAQCGCLGAAAGLAYLADLDENGVKNALGLAYSQIAGTMQAHVEGTPTLALQVGFAARAAVNAIDLAMAGFRGPHDVLDGKYGYFALIEGGEVNLDAFATLGSTWQITRVSHKPYPTGRAAQGGISALQSLMREHGFHADEVREVVLHAPPLIRQLVDRPYMHGMPVNYARLCLPYLLAVTLRDGGVGLSAYSAANLSDAGLRHLTNKIKIVGDSNVDKNALVPQAIAVSLVDGRTFSAQLPVVYGSPAAPMTRDAQRAKFSACCQHALAPLSPKQIDALLSEIDAIENTADATSWIALSVAN